MQTTMSAKNMTQVFTLYHFVQHTVQTVFAHELYEGKAERVRPWPREWRL